MAEIRARTNKKPGSVHKAKVETRYTQCLDETGWLMIHLEGPGAGNVSVPEFVKVVLMEKLGKDGKPTKENEKRTFFVVQEGRYQGKTASVSKENAGKCLVKATRGKGARITAKISGRKPEKSIPRNGEKYNQLWATLSFDGKEARITLDSDVNYYDPQELKKGLKIVHHSAPLPEGTYKILTPEAPHPKDDTDFYRTRRGGYPGLRYDTVWFQIENPATKNSNFVHVGNLSEGCVTMYQLEMWNVLYKYLIANRMDKDAMYVGTVTIE